MGSNGETPSFEQLVNSSSLNPNFACAQSLPLLLVKAELLCVLAAELCLILFHIVLPWVAMVKCLVLSSG